MAIHWGLFLAHGIIMLLPLAMTGSTSDDSRQTSNTPEQTIILTLPDDENRGLGELSSDTTNHDSQAQGVELSRQRRTIGGGRWPKSTVPYTFTDTVTQGGRIEIRRAQLTYERLTCFRFPLWVIATNGTTTNDKLELGHKNHLKFSKDDGCWSVLGNSWSSDGQGISCCSSTVCIHEIGHALGMHHEQASPDPARKWMIRINPDNITPAGRGQYYEASHTLTGYDITSFMHYGDWGFSAGGPTFTRLYPEQRESQGLYYLMMEASLAHECDTVYCGDSTLVCENDGYLTLVDGKCACMCVHGLDPDTGCTSILRSTSSTQDWPKGSYSLPQPKNGCADNTAKQGSRTHYTDGGNSVSGRFDVAGNITGSRVEHTFCTKEGSASQDIWPTGNYCIYRNGGACPEQFREGFVQYDDNTTVAASSVKGTVPDGVFGNNTRLEFCCRNNGFSWIPVFLPNRKPFVLIKNNENNCQSVRGMHVYDEYVEVKNSNDEGKAAYGGEDQPCGKVEGNVYRTGLCHYEPATIDCGSYIVLSKDTRSATFSSPQNGTELECTWFIKAPKHETIRLRFESFNIATSDRLMVRYFRPGQQGIVYTTGNKMNQTIQSVNSTLAIDLSTFGQSASSFRATVTLSLSEDLCYKTTDRGTSYTGKVNFTRWFESCLPWNEVTHCPHHPYVMATTGSNHTLLEGNYCRNPDFVTGIMPWCYTKADGCVRNYCDPCLLGEPYDTLTDCDGLSKIGFCNTTESKLNTCARTCGFDKNMPVAPPKAKDTTCAEPSRVIDGSIVGNRTTYSVGEIAVYTCNTNKHVTKSRVCLTSGQWSDMGFVCDVCPNGWHHDLNTSMCFGLIKDGVSQQGAIAGCAAQGWTIAAPKDISENSLINTLFPGLRLWLPLSDEKTEGTWVWSDGSVSQWVNWNVHQPDNWGYAPGEDCAFMMSNGKWGDMACSTNYWYVCKSPQTIMDASICTDFTERCPDLFKSNPSMCNTYREFGERVCPKTCGICVDGPSVHCDVISPLNGNVSSSKSQITKSSVLEYACNPGFVLLSGNKVRGCMSNGHLSGELPICVPTCPNGWTYLPETSMCAKYVAEQVNYETATSMCKNQGGRLVMPKTSMINSRIKEMFINKTTDAIWIGLNDLKVEGHFFWVDGQLLLGTVYKNWDSWEPNNFGGGEDCVSMTTSGKWNDRSCDGDMSYICEVPVGNVVSQCNVDNALVHTIASSDADVVVLDSVVTYSCSAGYSILSGSTNRTCMINGKMSGEPLVCIKSCPQNWVLSGLSKQCYRYFNNTANYDQASNTCRKMGGTLAMPKTKEDNTKVVGVRTENVYTWIGLDDKTTEGKFVWSDGEELTWAPWEWGQPNDWSGQDCVHLITNVVGQWNDDRCSSSFSFVCQIAYEKTKETCTVDPKLTNGKSSNSATSVSLDTEVTYTCDTGFVLASANTQRRCMINGQLSGEPAVCIKDCPGDWVFSGTSRQCYRYFSEKLDYDRAMASCVFLGGSLVTIKTPLENLKVSETRSEYVYTWIGLDDRAREGTFVWSDNETLTWASWSGWEPNNYGHNEDCAHLNTERSGRWNDNTCSNKLSYICQVPVEKAHDSCLVESPPTNGKTSMSKSTMALGETVKYSCDSRFVRGSGDTSRICMINGKLNGEPLTCSPDCPDDWVLSQSNSQCYRLFEVAVTFTGGIAKCKEWNGTLAMPKTSQQMSKLKEAMGESGWWVWIGLDDKITEGTFVWTDGSALGWSNWHYDNYSGKSEPDNTGYKGGPANCAHLVKGGKWMDIKCELSMGYTCQVDVNVINTGP